MKPIYTTDFYSIYNFVCTDAFNIENADDYFDGTAFIFIKSGILFYSQFGKEYKLSTGHILVSRAKNISCTSFASGKYIIITIKNEFYQSFSAQLTLNEIYFKTNPSFFLTALPEWEYLFYQMQGADTIFKSSELTLLVVELIAGIYTEASRNAIEENPDTTKKRFQIEAIERAKEYIHCNFHAGVSLKELSAYCYVSPSHFCRVFKQLTGYRPYQYLHKIRLKHGEMLLKSTDLSVLDISLLSGFSAPEYFSTSFKQMYKISPSRYRG